LRLLFYALGGFFFLASWLLSNHYPPWTTFQSEAAAFGALVAFCLASAGGARKLIRLPWRTSAVFAALVLLIWTQRAFGLITYGGDALVSSLFVVGIALAWWQGAHCALTPQESDASVVLAATLLVVAAAVSSFIAVLQWLQLDLVEGLFTVSLGPNMRPYGNMAQPNQLGTLLVIGTVMAYLLYERRYLKPWQFIVLALHLAIGLIVTESRTGLLSALSVGVLFLLCGKPEWHRGGWRVVATWWAVLLLLTKARGPLNEALLLQPARQVVLAVDDIRMTIWKQVAAAIAQSPWLGYGWRQTMTAQRHGIEVVPGQSPTEYAHNLVLDILAWVGIPLGLALLLLLGWWLLRTLRAVKNSTELLLFLAIVPVLVHSMLEFPFAYAYFLFTVAWMLGALHARQWPAGFQLAAAKPRFARPLLLAGILGFAALCGRVMLEYLEAEEDCRVMRFEMRHVGIRPPDHEAPQLFLLTQLDEMLKMGRMKPRRGMPAQDLERMRKANMTLDWGALHVNYVLALGLNGRPDDASRQLQSFRALYGQASYLQAVEAVHGMRDAGYPELGLVKTP
jgi:O-antigen ligase